MHSSSALHAASSLHGGCEQTMQQLMFYAVPVVVACIFAYIIAGTMLSVYETNETLLFYAIAALIVGIFSYFIASCFFLVYEMAVDTLLLCFCEDARINDGSPEKPYFMDRDLMEFVSNSTDAIDGLENKKRTRVPTEEPVETNTKPPPS